MPNTTLTTSIIAKEALAILENNCVMSKLVFRGMESEFDKRVNGYEPGDVVSIRRPTDFTVRIGPVAAIQDVTEGKTSITIDRQIGVDFRFTSQELTMKIEEISERVIAPAMNQIANQVDRDVMSLYTQVPNLVGTPGQTINSFSDFSAGPLRMDELAIPQDMRNAVLSPSDHWGMVGSQTALYVNDVAKSAYRNGALGNIAGLDTYESQNVPTHIVGVATGTPLVNGASQNVLYDNVKDSMTQSLVTDGWTNSVTGILRAGDVITIAGVFAVNPVTKAPLPFLRQFTVLADANSGATTGPATLSIYPAIITSGAFQTCTAAPADNAAITVLTGTGGIPYRQNLMFHKNAFALAMVPMVSPPGAVDVARQSYKGMSVRVIPYYDGSNDHSSYRLDVLYGVRAIDPRLAVRVYGTS